MKKNRNQGMTLVEIIVAIAILGIMAVSFLTVFYSGYSTIFTMGRKTQAMNEKAQTYMDMLYANYSAGITAIETTGSGMTVHEDVDMYSSIGLKLVTITVEYPSERSVSLTSLIP